MAIFGGYFGGYFGDYSKRTHHGILKLGLFHSGICLKVSPVEKSLGTFFPADLQLRTRVTYRNRKSELVTFNIEIGTVVL